MILRYDWHSNKPELGRYMSVVGIIGIIGIDAGTQGLSVVFVDESLQVLATGEGGYDMVAGLPEGSYEQRPKDWESALSTAMDGLRQNLHKQGVVDFTVNAIGISGQMHGEVLIDESQNSIGLSLIHI